MNDELFIKVKSAKSAEEFAALAREAGLNLPDEKLDRLYADLRNCGELADEDLDKVAGGRTENLNDEYDNVEHKSMSEYDPYFTQCPHCFTTPVNFVTMKQNFYTSGFLTVYFACPQCGNKFRIVYD